MKAFIKPILVLIFIILIVFLIYWLWQRQPKANKTQTVQTPVSTVSEKKSNKSANQNSFSLSVTDGQVFVDSKQKINGRIKPDSQLLIYSNNFENFEGPNDKGLFETEIELTKNLNLIYFIEFDRNLKVVQKQIFSFYLTDKNNQTKPNLVYSGSVKSIFDNVITITTFATDKKVRKNNQTQINLSQKSQPAVPLNKQKDNSKETDIRVGDYIIALGTTGSQESEIQASTIEIVRENKPELTKKFAGAKIASAVKNKTFSSYDIENNNLLGFVLDKNSKIFTAGKKTDEKSITKEKKAVITYTPINDNIVSSIYLLP